MRDLEPCCDGRRAGGCCPGELCLSSTYSPVLSCSPAASYAAPASREQLRPGDAPGLVLTAQGSGGRAPRGPGSDLVSARLPGACGSPVSGTARTEVPSGPAGSEEKEEEDKAERRLGGSQRPQQVHSPGREEPGSSAWQGSPSAKTPLHPHRGPALAPAALTVLGHVQVW